jgi:Skp family chaperone for outer membrane proteins
MKKTAIFASLLFAGAMLASTTSCGSDNKKDIANDSVKNVADSTVVEPIAQGDPYEIKTNIRYIDLAVLHSQYNLSKEIQAEIKKLDQELATYQNSLGQQLQTKQSEIQKKVQSNGYLSEESYNADMRELQKLDQTAQRNYATRADKASQRVAILQQTLTDSINNFIVEYNKTHKYDAILERSAGVYFNPALDVTTEVIEGLNARYKK